MNRNTIVSLCLILGVSIMNVSADAQDVGDVDGSPKLFVNLLGMKMIRVKAKAFDAWTSSLGRFISIRRKGGESDVPFALNRPRVPMRVELNDYYLAEFSVTNKMYRDFVEATDHKAPSGKLVNFYWAKVSGAPWELEDFKEDNLPVTGVNNVDISAFCKWLSETEGREYRPATIREFEYANRAGTDTLFWWGNYPDARYLNYGVSQINHPTPVGYYPPNPWGFYDLHGNVWEYCTDGGYWMVMGSSFTSPQRLTGADAWGNFNEGPNVMRVLCAGFRLACDADQGGERPGDLATPTILAAGGTGPSVAELEITVGERIDLGSNSGNVTSFLATRGGTWILKDKRSTDRGKTWNSCTQIGEAFCQLRDGTIISLHGPESGGSRPGFDHMKGMGSLKVMVSNDDWETVERFEAPLYVPLARRFSPVRGLVELKDGRLLATMYGYMDGDRIREDSPVGFELDSPWIKTRVIVIESNDRGKSWRYLSTLSCHPELGFEGQNETDIVALRNGLLFAAMRSGIHGYRDLHGRENLDQPLLRAWSADQGRTWSTPQRIYVKDKLITGIYPRTLVTEEGVLAVLRTRPDHSVIFSPDGEGAIWTDEVIYWSRGEGAHHASMQDMQLIGPNTILATDLVSKNGDWPPTGGWRAEGVPITVTKKK